MRRSEFDRALALEFGANSSSVFHDLVLSGVDYRTAEQALKDGVAPREVWLALCVEAQLPPDRYYGVGQLPGRKTGKA